MQLPEIRQMGIRADWRGLRDSQAEDYYCSVRRGALNQIKDSEGFSRQFAVIFAQRSSAD